MLLKHSEKLDRHSTRPFGAGFPLFNRTFAGVEITGEHRLTEIVGLARPLDLRNLLSVSVGYLFAKVKRTYSSSSSMLARFSIANRHSETGIGHLYVALRAI